MLIRSLFIVVLASASMGLRAQLLASSVVSTSGAYFSNTNASVSVTLGEAVQAYYSNASNSLSVGFQQAYPPLLKQLLLTIFLEGLYDGPSMRKAQNVSGDQFTGTVADRINVVLRQSTAPYTALTTLANVDLNTNGTAEANVTGSYGGNYYLVIQHRNHLETWTASPVSFAGTTISYNFTDASIKAYGNRLKDLGEGVFGIYAGDADANGLINLADVDSATASATAFATGYIPNDVNGDGTVDALDLILIDNNAANAVSVAHP
jgi:hypothetical protein